MTRRRMQMAAHVHSTWSYDGRYGIGELVRLFARFGYDGVLLSEHDRGWDDRRWDAFRAACEAATTSSFVVVPGVEYSDPDNDVHVLVWGCEDFLGAGLATEDLLDRAAERQGVAVLAHPRRRDALTRLPPMVLERFDGIEVWNRKYDGIQPSAAACAVAKEVQATPFVGLDFHTRRQLFPLSLAVDVAGDRGAAAIAGALRSLRAQPRVLGAPLAAATSPAGRFVLTGGERLRRAGAAALR